MFCGKCGATLADGAAFCPACGAQQNAAPQQPAYQAAPQQTYQQPTYQPAPQQTYQQPTYQPAPQQTYQQPTYQPAPQQTYQQPQYGQPQYGQPQYGQPQYGQPAPQGVLASPKHVGFMDAIKLFFQNYAKFDGRSTKSEYWWSVLFCFLIGLIPVVSYVAALAVFVPSLAITVRRLHDTGKSWTYILMSLIPFAGAIILIIQLCKDSDYDNQWGPAAR